MFSLQAPWQETPDQIRKKKEHGSSSWKSSPFQQNAADIKHPLICPWPYHLCPLLPLRGKLPLEHEISFSVIWPLIQLPACRQVRFWYLAVWSTVLSRERTYHFGNKFWQLHRVGHWPPSWGDLQWPSKVTQLLSHCQDQRRASWDHQLGGSPGPSSFIPEFASSVTATSLWQWPQMEAEQGIIWSTV